MQKKSSELPEVIKAMREKHGFHNDRKASLWSKQATDKGFVTDITLPPQQKDGSWPKNQPLFNALEQKFSWLGFKCKAQEGWVRAGKNKQHQRLSRWVVFENYPTVGSYAPTLTDLFLLPVELFDGYRRHLVPKTHLVGQPVNLNGTVTTMNATGIGYKGLSGVSWLPSLKPIPLAKYLEDVLVGIGDAIFLLYDAVAHLYEQKDPDVVSLLSHKVPSRISKMSLPGTVDIIRPDIVISSAEDGSHRFVITELESCPAGQGMTHAMQTGYKLSPAMADEFTTYLDGRDFVVLATHEWSEYTFEQAVFVKALRDRGVRAFILLDEDLGVIHNLALAKWKAPKELPPALLSSWDTNFLGRLRKYGFNEFVFGETLPVKIGASAVYYRFGYFDNFSSEWLNQMRVWQENGATIINPLQYYLESKSLMAAAKLPTVRAWISDRNKLVVETLDSCLAETRLIHSGLTSPEDLTNNRHYWLTKFAAWDGNNKSWGSRSLEFGSQHSDTSWMINIKDMSRLDHPVVVQHVIAPAEFQVAYAAADGTAQEFNRGRSRLTPFLLRGEHGTVHCGSTITLRENTVRIHGASDAVEGPVIFTD